MWVNTHSTSTPFMKPSYGLRSCCMFAIINKETDRMSILYIVSAFFAVISVGSVIALIIYNRER